MENNLIILSTRLCYNILSIYRIGDCYVKYYWKSS